MMWHEGVAKRGANNIASCIWRYIKANNTRKEFVFFSDNCSGQNKNRLVAAMYMHAVATLNVDRISHYFLERGHTENEGDSMHSTIEKSRQTGKYLHTNCSGTQLLRQPKDRGIPDSEELTEKGQFYHFLLSLTFTINTAFVRL